MVLLSYVWFEIILLQPPNSPASLLILKVHTKTILSRGNIALGKIAVKKSMQL